METSKIEGTVTGAFAHRFVITGAQGKTLIDIGPDARLPITEGDRLSVEGERKPSEIKVTSITLADGSIHKIVHGKNKHEYEVETDTTAIGEDAVIEAVQAAGYTVDGSITRKPHHFDVMANKDGGHVRVRVELNGAIKKVKAVDADA